MIIYFLFLGKLSSSRVQSAGYRLTMLNLGSKYRVHDFAIKIRHWRLIEKLEHLHQCLEVVNGLISVIRERRDSLRSDAEDDLGQEAKIEEECYKHTHTPNTQRMTQTQWT